MTANSEAFSGGNVVVIGAGPAGLTAALELTRAGVPCTVLEADTVVGGLSRTVEYRGFRFDIGGHRFYTKVTTISELWEEILGEDFLTRPRQSRIYYNHRFFNYPLKAGNVLGNLGLWEAGLCVLSYLRARVSPAEPEICFEDWVVNRFGRRLYRLFFKSYTEKVWGISCREIQAEWAAQRIRGLSLWSAMRTAFLPQRGHGSDAIKTLVDEFRYPRQGPGMLWERVTERVEQACGKVHLGAPVTRILWEPGRVTAVEAGGRLYPTGHLLSSMPIRDLLSKLDPSPSGALRSAIDCFHYRDFLTVALVIRRRDVFPDNWIYIHDPSVKVGRIQNYKNWSPEMTPSPDLTCLGLEYFCFEGDELWSAADEDLIALGAAELRKLGLADGAEVIDGAVVRMPKAYPVYDSLYRDGLDAVKQFLREVPNLQLIGRNGMHHYNNQDHSMLTGMLAARNVMGSQYDLWRVNAEGEYIEEGCLVSKEELDALRKTQPQVPKVVSTHAAKESL